MICWGVVKSSSRSEGWGGEIEKILHEIGASINNGVRRDLTEHRGSDNLLFLEE